jgi:S1-C subfamily serine protease/predicted esterase
MNIRICSILPALLVAVAPLVGQEPDGPDTAGLRQKVIAAAVARVAPSVVQIDTSGGTDVIGFGPQGPSIRKGTGPTTGLVVGADGYIVSSAFNFANKPSGIFVAVPGHKDRYPARVVATDHTRMLTLLKIDLGGLPVPAAVPHKDFRVGQSALALGRTWTGIDQDPSYSLGIISALDRIWGKAIQTDAKVSPVNYGGPLIDLAGRVMGVLVPASPRAQDETAGIEWYDSGIGFAIPLVDINAVLPRLEAGQDLRRGLLGIVAQSPDIYGAPPAIASVAPGSAADQAGIKPGDVISELSGTSIIRQAQVMQFLGSRYEGDIVSVKVKRGKETLSFPNLKLTGALIAFAHAFLGVLPMRDDPELGVVVRFIYPGSPAEKAGLKTGDRIMALELPSGPRLNVVGRGQLIEGLNHLSPGATLKLDVRRPDAKDLLHLTAQLDRIPDVVPDRLPQPASFHKALEPKKIPAQAGKAQAGKAQADKAQPAKSEPKKEAPKKPETGLLHKGNDARDHEYWVYVPPSYDPNISYGLVVWLHQPSAGKEKDIEAVVRTWEEACKDNHLIVLAPHAQNDTGWLASEADYVREAIQQVVSQYTIDRQRIIAHGMGLGGQMAFYLGFHVRDLIRGVATTSAPMTTPPADNFPAQRLSFFIAAGGRDPIVKSIAEIKPKLAEKKFPVIYRLIDEMGHEYLDAGTFAELVRWIDALDRL